MKVALDTNVLAYAEGVNGVQRRDAALDLVRKLPSESVVVPVQVLGELFNVLVRKAARSPAVARDAVLAWRDAFAVVGTSPEVMITALDLATDHHLGLWDSVIMAGSARAGCRLLLSEDLQHGFTWGGVTVVDPFSSPAHSLLLAVLSPPAG